jgi:hypothetical protein
MFLLPSTGLGIGSACMWGPLAATATRHLAPQNAGAGSGVYNATRTVGSAVGSAAMAAFMQARLTANLPNSAEQTGGASLIGAGPLPEGLVEPFSTAMGQAILLPAAVMAIGALAMLFLRDNKRAPSRSPVAGG